MSAREWKPGDVALVEAGCWANRKVALRLAEGWSHVNGVNPDEDGVVSPVRRLAVIDPEDIETLDLLASQFMGLWSGCGGSRALALQGVLRVFAGVVAKPEEPTGLGAVVLDSQGTEVVHIGDGVWTRNGGPRADWSLVDAVKVLSEGVTA